MSKKIKTKTLTSTAAECVMSDAVKFKIVRQGGPILNRGWVVAAGKNVVAIEMDMRSKWCEMEAEYKTPGGAPCVSIGGANERALYLKKSREKEPTEVAFPEYKGWDIFSAHVCRYTFCACFVRR